MVNKSSVRLQNTERFDLCVALRQKGYSYSEIQKQIPVSKSTLQNWLTLAGLTLTQEHQIIKSNNQHKNYRLYGIQASKIKRLERNNKYIEDRICELSPFIREPLFIAGVMCYEAEGSKIPAFRISNSDYRIIVLFRNFIMKYFLGISKDHLHYRLFIHETRSEDLQRITNYWAGVLDINSRSLKISWKRNIVTRRRTNQDYFGQISMTIVKQKLAIPIILRLSGIIMRDYCGIV